MRATARILLLVGALAGGTLTWVAPSGAAPTGVVDDIAIGGATTFPAFDEGTFDYAIRCTGESTSTTFTIDAATADSLTVDGTPVTSNDEVDVDLSPDDLTVVAVTAGSETVDYHYRCLPPDFPSYTLDRPGEPGPGLFFVSFGWPRTNQPTQSPFVAMLDGQGVPIWYKRTEVRVIDQKVLANGNLAWQESGAGPRSYEERTLDGTLVTHRRTVGHGTDNHDLLELRNGNIMLMSYVDRPCVDLTELGLGTCETAVDGYLQEIEPSTGALVWEWRSQDHIPVSDRALGPGTGQIPDLVHLNSVDEFADGDLLVSARSSGVYRIDRTTGAVEWKLGGGPGTDRLTTVDDPFDGTWRQHDARVLDDDTISVYDNQSGRTQPRAVKFDIDEVARTATLVWEKVHGGTLDSGFIGAHRVQPDGHSVITWGGISPFFEEVDADGNRLFALTLASQWEYRTVKVEDGRFALDDLRAATGGAVERDAPTDVAATPDGHAAVLTWQAPPIGTPTAYEATAVPGGRSCSTGGALTCTIDDLTPGTTYTFTVRADNEFGGSLASYPSDGLAIASPVSGTVTDGTTGSPIAGAVVRLYRSGTTDFAEVVTDTDGLYRFGDVAAGFYKLRFAALGFEARWWDSSTSKYHAPSILVGPRSSFVGDQVLPRRQGSLSGRVSDADTGAGLGSATVRFYRAGTTSFTETTTNPDGTYAMELPRAFYKVQVLRGGYGPSWYDGESNQWAAASVLVGASTTGIDVALTPVKGTVRGEVLDAATDAPVEGATVRLVPTGGSEPLTATTDGTGTYEIADVPGGFYKAEFSKAGYQAVWFRDAPTQAAGTGILTGWNTTVVDQPMTPAL